MVFSKGKSCYVKTGNNAKYFPQTEERNTVRKGNVTIYGNNNILHKYNNKSHVSYKIYDTKMPISILKFNTDEHRLHPTQKPVKLLEYLIKTYTCENDLVLDNCMGSGSTGVASVLLKRNFIGIELEDKYFEIAKIRIENAEKYGADKSKITLKKKEIRLW